MTKILRCIVVSLILTGLAACSGPADDAIHFGIASAPANLDPRFATDATSARLNRLLYQRLVDFDENVKPVPALATWKQLAPLHYRFYLQRPRPDFHDGTPLTARDVAATYRSILDPANASPHAGTLQLVKRIEVLDDDRLDFFLHRADPVFPGYAVIGILPAAGIESGAPFHKSPVGSGPFRLDDWPEPGRLRLARISDGQAFEFQRIGDPTVRVLKLLRGEIDLLQNDLPAELIAYLDAQADIDVQLGPGSNFAYLGFNMTDPVTGNRLVRLAVAHAIDRESIIRHVLGGAARTAAAILPPEHWAGLAESGAVEYNPDESRFLLHQAGYDADNQLVLEYKTSTDPVRVRIATIIQQQLADVGIRMELRSFDWGTYFGDIKSGRFQMYSLMWVGIKTPDIFRYAFHSRSLPPAGANRGRLEDPVVDQLIEHAESRKTLLSQANGWRKVQTHLSRQLPYIPLWYEDHVFAARNGISGYRLALDGNYDGLVAVQRNGL